ncbi:MAG TPA: hypothetical protein VK612_05190 [Pyrinomonadaceae bacterium]|nr:hypothetical protein [Pyrinomonadaceae bacterium]
MDNANCKHDGCNCSVTGDAEFCSDHCKEISEQEIIEIACDCGHSGCDFGA